MKLKKEIKMRAALFTLMLFISPASYSGADTTNPTPTTTAKTIQAAAQTMPLNKAVQQAENWFNRVTTLQADFSQSINNRTQTGQFYLSRPGKFLWQYQMPTPQKIVSTGAYVFFHDESTNQTTQVPRSMPLVRLLNAKTVSLNGNGFKPLNATQTTATYSLNVALMDEGIEEGRFTLHFNKQPEQLTHITMTDTLGTQTIIRFSNMKRGLKLNSDLFKFTPPQYQEN